MKYFGHGAMSRDGPTILLGFAGQVMFVAATIVAVFEAWRDTV